MLSIFIMYSPDREFILKRTISRLSAMSGYPKCQKILLVDTFTEWCPKDWGVVQVPRIGMDFCWGRMWDAGVGSARFEKLVYLDSDRLLPDNFLDLMAETIQDQRFVSTSKHFMLTGNLEDPDLQTFLRTPVKEGLIIENPFVSNLKFEPCMMMPVHGPGKNVMSGCTGFTRSTYINLGGMDHWYRGHGAFADTDFHQQAALGGCDFFDLDIPEIHISHSKLEYGHALDPMTLRRMGLDNFIYYCLKWSQPIKLAEALAKRCGVFKPHQYIEQKVKEFSQG